MIQNKFLQSLCNTTLPHIDVQPITDILLVTVFNFPNFSIIPFLEVLLRPTFARIVYCGYKPSDNMTLHNMDKYKRKGIKIFTYPEPAGIHAGGFSMGQICPVLAMKYIKDVQVLTILLLESYLDQT